MATDPPSGLRARTSPAAMAATLRDPDTVRAVGLAVATLGANGIALVFTVVFARILGADGYGSLARLVSTFLIISVPGSALQVAAARETALGRLGDGSELAGTLARWAKHVSLAFVGVTAVALLLRHQVAHVIRVDQIFAAALTLSTGVVWLALCVERGVLQGLRSYRAVGASIVFEAAGRLVLGLLLVGLGAGVAGAYLGTPLSMFATALALAWVLRRRLGHVPGESSDHRLRDLARGSWAPVIGLCLVAVLQNIDVIFVRHRVGGDEAGSYAAAAVAAKLIVWVAIGIGMYLLPEAARHAHAGRDARPVLVRGLAVIGAVAAPALAVFLLAPETLMRVAFGAGMTEAAPALPVLGAAMVLLALAYLGVQYLLAVARFTFLWILAAVAALECVLLLTIAAPTTVEFAAVVLGVQAVAALAVLTLALRAPLTASDAPLLADPGAFADRHPEPAIAAWRPGAPQPGEAAEASAGDRP